MAYALIANIIVWIYITFHTGSLAVASCAMSMILVSFPVTTVIYKNIVGITNVSSLHLMVTFVVLGISADNIFVLWDAWTQSSKITVYTKME